MVPAGRVSSATPALAAVDSLLFVVDREHAVPGASGRVSIEDVRVLGTARQQEGP